MQVAHALAGHANLFGCHCFDHAAPPARRSTVWPQPRHSAGVGNILPSVLRDNKKTRPRRRLLPAWPVFFIIIQGWFGLWLMPVAAVVVAIAVPIVVPISVAANGGFHPAQPLPHARAHA